MKRIAPALLLIAAACSVTFYVRQESDTLYFGTAKPDGSSVSEAQWRQFVTEVVTPRFPGFTQWNAVGDWKGTEEAAHVVVIVHEPGREREIQEIIEAYERRFDQEAVFQVREDVWLRRSSQPRAK
ncbi:MAG TPA: DUF3574 domain-containing protein [Thermoanaerobaculia bacterium]|jgi:hypothetical protein|nr:DUF3574 domain-containing protein [Thermoanaerobaculia bacterium]